MGLGTGIALLVIGGILAFGVQDSIEAINLTVIGYICMAAGALAIILSLVMRGGGGYSSRRVTHSDPATGTRVDETHVDRDGL